MHAAHPLNLRPDMQFFSEGGIGPDGECWVVPTPLFLRLWDSPSSVDMKKQGFRLGDDGKRVGASQERVLYFPVRKNMN